MDSREHADVELTEDILANAVDRAIRTHETIMGELAWLRASMAGVGSEASAEWLDERAHPRDRQDCPGRDGLAGILSHRAVPRVHSPGRRHPLGAAAHRLD